MIIDIHWKKTASMRKIDGYICKNVKLNKLRINTIVNFVDTLLINIIKGMVQLCNLFSLNLISVCAKQNQVLHSSIFFLNIVPA